MLVSRSVDFVDFVIRGLVSPFEFFFSDWIEKAKGQISGERNILTHVVPVSGRLFAIFRTSEQDHQTALEVWDWEERAKEKEREERRKEGNIGSQSECNDK
jgi:hypothetical protein